MGQTTGAKVWIMTKVLFKLSMKNEIYFYCAGEKMLLWMQV